jgi:hypothetical protein
MAAQDLQRQRLEPFGAKAALSSPRKLPIARGHPPFHQRHGAALDEVRTWIRAHNRAVRQHGTGVRIVAFYLPSKSPWLNRIEPHWVHGKRNIVEPARLLSAQEVADRVCAYFGCVHESHLALTENVT